MQNVYGSAESHPINHPIGSPEPILAQFVDSWSISVPPLGRARVLPDLCEPQGDSEVVNYVSRKREKVIF